ncbi:MAG: hypothetical protein ACLTDR_04810 [Adlercreutzia equolifaciens]
MRGARDARGQSTVEAAVAPARWSSCLVLLLSVQPGIVLYDRAWSWPVRRPRARRLLATTRRRCGDWRGGTRAAA